MVFPNRCVERAVQLALRGLPESLVGADTLMYGHWLWHYAFWDFFNLRSFYSSLSLFVDLNAPLELYSPYRRLGLLRVFPILWHTLFPASASVTRLCWSVLESLLDDLWLDFWLA